MKILSKMDDLNFEELKITGTKINYLHVCKRKLWLFSNGITMEHTSEKVLLGYLIGEYSYPRENKRKITLDDLIQIDILNKDFIKEVKYSDKLKEADIAQLAYYLFYLKSRGIEKVGVITYPKLKKKEELKLTKELEDLVKKDLKGVEEILKLPKPPSAVRKPYCKSCSYYEFCWG